MTCRSTLAMPNFSILRVSRSSMASARSIPVTRPAGPTAWAKAQRHGAGAGGDIENFFARCGPKARDQPVGAEGKEPQRRAIVITRDKIEDPRDLFVRGINSDGWRHMAHCDLESRHFTTVALPDRETQPARPWGGRTRVGFCGLGMPGYGRKASLATATSGIPQDPLCWPEVTPCVTFFLCHVPDMPALTRIKPDHPAKCCHPSAAANQPSSREYPAAREPPMVSTQGAKHAQEQGLESIDRATGGVTMSLNIFYKICGNCMTHVPYDATECACGRSFELDKPDLTRTAEAIRTESEEHLYEAYLEARMQQTLDALRAVREECGTGKWTREQAEKVRHALKAVELARRGPHGATPEGCRRQRGRAGRKGAARAAAGGKTSGRAGHAGGARLLTGNAREPTRGPGADGRASVASDTSATTLPALLRHRPDRRHALRLRL